MRVFIMHMDLEWSDILRYVLQLSDKEIAKRAKAVDMYMFWAWLLKFVLHRIKERVQEIPREKW